MMLLARLGFSLVVQFPKTPGCFQFTCCYSIPYVSNQNQRSCLDVVTKPKDFGLLHSGLCALPAHSPPD